MSEYIKIIQGIRNLVTGKQPEMNICNLLFEHKCFYLLSKCKSYNIDNYKCKAEIMQNIVKVRESFKICDAIFKELNKKNLPYAVIKGAVLSQVIYKKPYYRCSSDIDILIQRKNVDIVKHIMEKEGFIQGRVTLKGIEPFSRKELLYQSAMSHQIAPFVKTTEIKLVPYINVDINLDIMWGESKKKTDMEFVLEHTISSELYQVPLKKLDVEMEFISLCLHHYKDMNSIYLLSQKSLKLCLVCDIYYYLINVSLDVEKLYDISQVLEVGQYIYYCIYYCNLIFDDNRIKRVMKEFYSEKAVDLLKYFGLEPFEREIWKNDFFERLFSADFDMYDYFLKTLPIKSLEKIEFNKTFM